MPELYETIQPYLAAVGLSAIGFGGIFLGAVAAVKWFGEKWVTSKFTERLEAFKHVQQREIEQLKFQINASMDRAVKLHQREFDTLPEAWSKLLTSYNYVKVFTSPFQSYAAVGRMTDTELDEFLEDTEFSTTDKSDIKASTDRDQAYQKVWFWFRLNKAYAVCRENNDFLQKNAIFMPASIKAKFDAVSDITWDALSEHKIRHEMKTWGERPKLDRLDNEGEATVRGLEAEIQKRLWSDVKIT